LPSFRIQQAVEKHPSAALRSSFVIAWLSSLAEHGQGGQAGVPESTPHSSGFHVPCIWMLLISLGKTAFSTPC